MEKTQRALYLFCFARPHAVSEVEGMGVDGQHPVCLFQYPPDLCAVASEVLLEDFCGPAAEGKMQQLAWVGPRALRHEEVVEQVTRHSPVLPVRFGTLFSSQRSLGEFLDTHRQTISQFLERVADQEEWSIKGLLDRKQAGQALTSARLTAQQEQLATLPPGTRYFQERRIRSVADKELSRWLNETCQQVVSDLRKQASDFRECQVVPREPPDSGTEVVLNWAFLLPRGASAAFRLRINQVNAGHATTGLVFELSGPWPPYRFVPPLSMGTAP
jgi:hypothetical protein